MKAWTLNEGYLDEKIPTLHVAPREQDLLAHLLIFEVGTLISEVMKDGRA